MSYCDLLIAANNRRIVWIGRDVLCPSFMSYSVLLFAAQESSFVGCCEPFFHIFPFSMNHHERTIFRQTTVNRPLLVGFDPYYPSNHCASANSRWELLKSIFFRNDGDGIPTCSCGSKKCRATNLCSGPMNSPAPNLAGETDGSVASMFFESHFVIFAAGKLELC